MYPDLTSQEQSLRIAEIVKELIRRGFDIESVVLDYSCGGSGKLVVNLNTPKGIAFSVNTGTEGHPPELCRIVENDSVVRFEKQDRFDLLIKDPFVEGSDDVNAVELIVESLSESYSNVRKGLTEEIERLNGQLMTAVVIHSKLV